MKRLVILIHIIPWVLMASLPSIGEENVSRSDHRGDASLGDSQVKAIHQYHPTIYVEIPKLGYSNFRIGASTRSGDEEFLLTTLVTKDHIGLTTKAQPSFFWYQSKSVDLKFTFQLKAVNQEEPLFRLELNSPLESGVHRIRLLDLLGISLSPHVDYEWMVAYQPEGSPTVIARGYIRRIDMSMQLATELSRAKKSELPFIYIDKGLWYDALEAIEDLIELHPNDETYQRIRGELLKKVGLIQELEKEEPEGPTAALALMGKHQELSGQEGTSGY